MPSSAQAESIAGPKFVPPQQHDSQGLNSRHAGNTAAAVFMTQQHRQLLLCHEGCHSWILEQHACPLLMPNPSLVVLAVQLVTQVSMATVCMS